MTMNKKDIKEGIELIKKLGLMPPNELGPLELASYFPTILDARASPSLVGLKAVGAPGKSYLGVKTSVFGPSPVVLVGKGITFDSGGISIKPGNGMKDMKFDMLGAATVLACVNAYKGETPLTAIAPCAENTFHANTYRPGDVLTFYNGIKVEVDNTDAEGRLVLADGIIEAKGHNPSLIITVATLTGAAKAAVGEATALFSNDERMTKKFMKCAEECKERVWRLPLWEEHREALKVKWDEEFKGVFISNCVKGPGASTAAAFLEAFVGDTPWIHLDIAGSAYKDGVPTGAMFKTLLKFISSM